MHRRSSWLPAALAIGVLLLAGCGSSSSSSNSTASQSSSPATTGATTTAPTSSTSSTRSKSVQQIVIRACKTQIPPVNLTSPQRKKLEAICNKAGNADSATLKKLAQEVCVEAVKIGSGKATSAEREQAIAACKG